MNQLAARDALTSRTVRVSLDERAGFAHPNVFAVFDTDLPDASLVGLVTPEQTSGYPNRIFADLLPREQAEPVGLDTDLDTVFSKMEAHHSPALSVLDDGGQFIGAVTRESLWAALHQQQRRMVDELAARNTAQGAMLDAIPDHLLWVTHDGTILRVSRPAGSAFWPNPSEDATGKNLSDVFLPKVADVLRKCIRRHHETKKGPPCTFTFIDGDVVRDYEARFGSWGLKNVLVICRDVTEINALRSRLVVSDRMASIGTLAAGVAHEINNPLSYVSANLDVLRKLLVPEPATRELLLDTRELLDDMREGINRVIHTVRDLKVFSRPEDQTRKAIDLTRVLTVTSHLAQNEIRYRARFVSELGPVPTVNASEAQLGQVFLNLLVNAAQSIPEGAAHANEVRIVTRTDRAGCAVIEVHDTGAGIPEEIRARIFMPFFTTKAVGVGTGLGLSICQGIVVGHGGRMEVASTLGEGSVFMVVLPPAPPEVPTQPSLPAFRYERPRGRFLVVDDEPGILKVYCRLLGADQCVTASSGREALVLLRGGERFDAILCDLMMPDTSGVQVYEELERFAPKQARRMLFATGGAFTGPAREFMETRPNRLIEKPFDDQVLLGRLTWMLEETMSPKTAIDW